MTGVYTVRLGDAIRPPNLESVGLCSMGRNVCTFESRLLPSRRFGVYKKNELHQRDLTST